MTKKWPQVVIEAQLSLRRLTHNPEHQLPLFIVEGAPV